MATKPEPLLTNDQRIKAFLKRLDENARSKSPGEKFRDWCELAYCAVAKLTAPTEERADALEARYMAIVERYKRDEQELIFIRESAPHMMAIAQMAVAGGGVDFLGQAAGQLEVLNPGAGQFFTPYEVSRMLAEMSLGDLDQLIKRDGYVTLSEPAAGSGGMVLAVADHFEREGHPIGTRLLVHAVDISALAYYMLFLQLTWRGVPALVQRANSLSMEVFEGGWTVAAVTTFLEHHGHLSFSKPAGERADARDEPIIVTTPVQSKGTQDEPEDEPELVQLAFF